MRRTQRSRRRLDIYRHTPTARTADSGGRSLRDLDLQKRLPESAALYDLQWDFREHAISRSRPCVWTFVWRLVREGSGPEVCPPVAGWPRSSSESCTIQSLTSRSLLEYL